MFFAPNLTRRHAYGTAPVRTMSPWRDSLFDEVLASAFAPAASATANAAACARVAQDDQAWTVSLDVPGLAREHLTVTIDETTVRVESKADAPRQVRAAWSLPQAVDAAASKAKLEHGVLTLTLAKLQPVDRSTVLSIE